MDIEQTQTKVLVDEEITQKVEFKIEKPKVISEFKVLGSSEFDKKSKVKYFNVLKLFKYICRNILFYMYTVITIISYLFCISGRKSLTILVVSCLQCIQEPSRAHM